MQNISFALPSLVLSLLFSAITIALESTFNVGGRIIDEIHANLLPDAVEVLVTIDNWIESKKKDE